MTEEAFRVYLTFDRGTMVNKPGPTMLLKYGRMPTMINYDQLIQLNDTETDFYNIRVERLRVGDLNFYPSYF